MEMSGNPLLTSLAAQRGRDEDKEGTPHLILPIKARKDE